jgi:SAM-dependent methyltransferase
VRLGAVAETPLEWAALRLQRVPTPLIDTHLAFAFARTVMAATRLGVFDALADGPGDAPSVAETCGTASEPTRRLLDALTGMGYLRPAGGSRYALSRAARRWLTARSPASVVEKVLFGYDEWAFVEHYDRYLVSGEALGMHAWLSAAPAEPAEGSRRAAPSDGRGAVATGTGAGWERYQRALHALATVSTGEVARRTPVPRQARAMLDVGGAHGAFAAALVRRHRALRATVLDLPEAVTASAPLLAANGLGERLTHRVGDALTSDLGEAAFDLVLASQLTHHLSDDSNRLLARKVARALRPGGVYVVQDLVRPADPREARRARLGALLDLYFAATSGSGTFTLAAMRAWQRDAGLVPRRTTWMRTLPGMVQQAAVKYR